MAMRYRDLTIEIESREDGQFDATAISDQFHDRPRVTFRRPIGNRALASIHAAIDRRIGGVEPAGQSPRDVGGRLHRALFQREMAELLRKCRTELKRTENEGLRIRLRFDPRDAEAPYLADLPWELLCDPENGQFLAADNRTPVVRQLLTRHRKEGLEVSPPLRILVVDAAETDMRARGLKLESERIQEALGTLASAGEVELLPPPKPTYDALRDALLEHQPHVLDFLGHGGYDPSAHRGAIRLEDGAGNTDMVDGERLADLLKGIPSLRLVMLNACKSARHGGTAGAPEFYGAVAGILTLVGLPAVVANQYTISQRAAVQFSASFYGRLAKGDAVDEALAEARLRIRGQSFEWATPVLFLSAEDGKLFRITSRRAARATRGTARGDRPTVAQTASTPSRAANRAVQPTAVRLGIRSMIGWAPELEKEADHTLDLTRHFDARFDDRRFITTPEHWQSAIYPEVRTFLRRHCSDSRRPVVLQFAAHQSIAFVAGWVYEAKSGLDVTVKQYTSRGGSFEWRPDDGTLPGDVRRAEPPRPIGYSGESAAVTDGLWQTRRDIELDPTGTDVAVAVSLTHEIVADVRACVAAQCLSIGRIVDATIAPEPGHEALKGGEHALRLAQRLIRRISAQRPNERGGRLHIFGAGPNAFFFYLGQMARSLGRIVLYEFPFGRPDLERRYQKSIELPPPDEVHELPAGW